MTASGFHQVERRVEILEGTLTRVSAELRRVPAPLVERPLVERGVPAATPVEHVAPPSDATDNDTDTVRALGGVSLGLAAGGLAAGVALAVFREERAAYWNSDDCLGHTPTLTRMQNCGSVLEEISGAEVGLSVGFASAGAFLAVGVTLLVVGATGEPEHTGFGCAPGPGDLGLACGARF